MPQVVHEAGERHAEHVAVGDPELGLDAAEVRCPHFSQVGNAERVLEAVVDGARKDPTARG